MNTINSEGKVITQEYIISRLFPEGLYYVKRVDGNTVKFAKSQSDIFGGIFTKVNPDGGVDSVTIASQGNAVNWGDFRTEKQNGGASSDSHRGL